MMLAVIPETTDDPEQDVLRALDQGDVRSALSTLMDAYGTSVYRFCLQMLADEALADDVQQITFLQAYEGLPAFSRRSTLKTWLFSIARHRSLDTLKMRRRRWRRFRQVDSMPDPAEDREGHDQNLVHQGRRQALALCLRNLQAKVRSAVLLRYQEGLSYPEMAQICGERPPTLQARVTRALPVLRRCLEERGTAR